MSRIKKYVELGFSICPSGIVKDKRQPLMAWAKLKETPLTMQEAIEAFKNPLATGVTMFCGDVSGGVRCIDVEVKSDLTGTLWDDLKSCIRNANLQLWDKFVIQKTKSNGYHLYFRYLGAGAGKHLAKRAATESELKEKPTKTTFLLIEEQGDGNPITLFPTPNYSLERGDFEQIQTLTESEYECLINICKHFNQYTERPKEAYVPKQKKIEFGVNNQRPVYEIYNEKINIVDVMMGLGWQNRGKQGMRIIFSKPNRRERDCDASVKVGENSIMFWAATKYENGKSYTPFDIFKIENGYDNARACKELELQGYTDKEIAQTSQNKPIKRQSLNEQWNEAVKEETPQIEQKAVVDEVDELMKRLEENRFRFNDPIKPANYILKFDVEGEIYDGAARGNIVVVSGAAKSRKTTLALGMAASALAAKNCINVNLCVSKSENIVWFDTEQPDDDFKYTQHRILKTANIVGDPANYYAYNILDFTRKERLLLVIEKMKRLENTAVCVVDGIVDLVEDYNDNKESEAIVDELNRLAKTKNLMLVVCLHEARSTGNLRGHLGTALINKAGLVLKVQADAEKEFSTVHCSYGRKRKFPSFTFTMDNEGLPCLELPIEQQIDWNKAQARANSNNSNYYPNTDYQNPSDIEAPF